MAVIPENAKSKGTVTLTKDKTAVKEVKLPERENIIFIGSENEYNSFWLKMMFIGAAFKFARDKTRCRPAEKHTIAYVKKGYNKAELLAIDNLQKELPNCRVKQLTSSGDVISLMNEGRENYKLQDVAFFCHGLPERIALDYNAGKIELRTNNYSSLSRSIFNTEGRLYSYACRTGVVNLGLLDSMYKDEATAKPQDSLAQKLANHLKIEVHAFLRRSFYGGVLRVASDSARISGILKKEREKLEGSIIQIPTKHEALPHEGLGNGFWGLHGASAEGTKDYALWRKLGGLTLPTAADTPPNLPTDYRVFKPI